MIHVGCKLNTKSDLCGSFLQILQRKNTCYILVFDLPILSTNPLPWVSLKNKLYYILRK